MPSHPRRLAFSLIELLVVISIVALLIAVLLPVLGSARGVARAAVCLSNQRQTTIALLAYTNDFDGSFAPNQQDHTAPAGARWWFGFEPGGPRPATTPDRPLDKTRSPLAPFFGGDILEGLRCPDFPANDRRFFAKFDKPSAHFGYNESLAPLKYKNLPPQRIGAIRQPSEVFAFADALHLDGLKKIGGLNAFYEPHYLQHNKNPAWPTGFGHFRHQRNAHTALLDGHVTARPQTEPTFDTLAGSPAANLDHTWGTDSIYGFDTGY